MRWGNGMALLLLSATLLLFAGYGQKKSKEATSSAVSSTASVSEESAATGTVAEAEETLSGVVLEASMNGFTLQNKDRGLTYITTGEDVTGEPDLTRLADGTMPEEGIRLLGKTEDGTFQLSVAADEATALGDKGTLYMVGRALLAVRGKNPDALAGMATYPLYLGLASDNEVDNKDKLLQRYTAEQIFIDVSCESVLHADLLTIKAADGNLVVSTNDDRPDMIFAKTDAGYKLSTVDVTKQERRYPMSEGKKATEATTEEAAGGERREENFIESEIDKDLASGGYSHVQTRFPPKPNGYLHVGHAKPILLNSGLAEEYHGLFNLRYGDTNPTKEKWEFVESIHVDIGWFGAKFGDRILFVSSYFETMYEYTVKLVKKSKAFVCDLTTDQIREYRDDSNTPGKENPYRSRSVEENLKLFEKMREGRYTGSERVLRVKIDMASPNINMRNPVIYHIAHLSHRNTGDRWCIYPMYDFVHPIEDVVEYITHSICTLEFEGHRPLYNWAMNECEFEEPPRQIEFAKLYLTNVVTGKRYVKKLIENSIVDGQGDPHLVSIVALRHRDYTPESIKYFVEPVGVSRVDSSVDSAMPEYCIREDLRLPHARMMAVLKPLRLIIDNCPEGQTEDLVMPNNLENSELGSRMIPFGGELWIEGGDFREEPPKKYSRLSLDNEVCLMGAYFAKCAGVDKDETDKVVVVHCTYNPETRSGTDFESRRVEGTVHWVNALTAVSTGCRLYENLADEEKGKLDASGNLNLNPSSRIILKDCKLESNFDGIRAYDSYQFVRDGFFCVDSRDSRPGNLIFNRIVSLKSSFKL